MDEDFTTVYRTLKLEPDQIERLQRIFDYPTTTVSNSNRFFWRACKMLAEHLETHSPKELFQYAEVGGVRRQYGVFRLDAEWVDKFAIDAPVSKGRIWFTALRLYLPVIEEELGLSNSSE